MPYLSRIIKGAQIGEEGHLRLEVRYLAPEEPLHRGEGVGQDLQVNIMDDIGRLECQNLELQEAARRESENIISQAREKAEKLMEEAMQEGRRRGYEEGLKKAQDTALKIKEEAETIFEEASRARADTIRGMEREIVQLATEIAQKIVSRQLDVNPETVLGIATEAIGRATGRVMVRLYVNPGERDMFNKRRGELAGLLSDRGLLYIIPDSGVNPGGCIIETDNGKIDASLDSRWEEVLKALLPEVADG